MTKCSFSIQQFEIILIWIEWYCNRINGSWVLSVNRFQKLTFELCASVPMRWKLNSENISAEVRENVCSADWMDIFLWMWNKEFNALNKKWEVLFVVILFSGTHTHTHNTYTFYIMKPIDLVCEQTVWARVFRLLVVVASSCFFHLQIYFDLCWRICFVWSTIMA